MRRSGSVPRTDREPAFRLEPLDALELERVRSNELGDHSVSPELQKLLQVTTRKEATRLASQLVLQGTAFFDLVRNCGALGFVHAEDHWLVLPDARALSPAERVAVLYEKDVDDRAKLRTKIRDGFREREHLSWHMFKRSAHWHCFYYSNRDLAGHPDTGEAHWVHGSHVHYVSDLLTPKSCEEFIASLKPGVRRPAGAHVRFQSSFSDEDWRELFEG